MSIGRIAVITAIIIMSLAVGYLRGKRRYIAIGLLGVTLAFYVAIFLGK